MNISDYKTIEVEQQGALDILWLNRPEHLNSINTPMVTELRHYFINWLKMKAPGWSLWVVAGKRFVQG